MNDFAIFSLTPRGRALGNRLQEALGQGEIVETPLREGMEASFRKGQPLVCIMALGIVVRILGPMLNSKETDPPVVVMDELGRFAISLLSGHQGGGNEFAARVAHAIGATPVITTASDLLRVPSVDLIGKPWNWKLENREDVTRVSAVVVRGEAIGVFQNAGRRDWWASFGEWPANFRIVDSWPPSGSYAGILAVTDQVLKETPSSPFVTFRPQSLVLGVGCRRGVSFAIIEKMFQSLMKNFSFSPLSLAMIASAEIKGDEPGLQEFAAYHKVPFRLFNLPELGAVPCLPTPSSKVREKLGISGVAEPAAMLAANSQALLVTKQKGPGVTMAIARKLD